MGPGEFGGTVLTLVLSVPTLLLVYFAGRGAGESYPLRLIRRMQAVCVLVAGMMIYGIWTISSAPVMDTVLTVLHVAALQLGAVHGQRRSRDAANRANRARASGP